MLGFVEKPESVVAFVENVQQIELVVEMVEGDVVAVVF